MAALTLGMTVSFKHRHTYRAPAGQPLTGIVTEIKKGEDGQWELTVWSEAAEMSYGLLPKQVRAGTKVAESATVRLANLKRADASKIAHYAEAKVWRETFAAEPGYSFFPKAIAALEREVGA